MLRIIPLLLFISLSNSLGVKTKLGEIRGSEKTSRDGRLYHAFTGIPYAKPPVGKLRLKNPVRAEGWQGVLDATKPVEPCLQSLMYIHHLRNTVFGQEDCLYLNVYTPQINNTGKLPVMVYIHGGGFRCGSPGPEYSPGYLMDEDIVLVSFQYRVGVLGFLSFEDEVIPGNFGLKDQLEALKWVKANIESFGGDENQVTIFGESAGGASTHFHMLAPKSRGLLKGVISESGVFSKIWGYSYSGSARPKAEKVSAKFGCNNQAGNQVLECLQQVDGKELTKAELDFLYWDYNPAVVFRPVQELPSDGAVMDFDPFSMQSNLPWIVGMVKEEGNFPRASLMHQDPSVTQQFIDNVEEYIRRIINFENATCSDSLTTSLKELKNEYFRQPMTVDSTREDMVDFITDSHFSYPINEAVSRHNGPVYLYLYDYRAASSLYDSLTPDVNLGTSHAEEVLLLFNWTENFPTTDPKDLTPSKNLVKMWANFAKYSKPETEDIRWPELRSSGGEYLHFKQPITTGHNLKQDIYKWWVDLPIFKSPNNIKTEL